jgi:hypothetical protein
MDEPVEVLTVAEAAGGAVVTAPPVSTIPHQTAAVSAGNVTFTPWPRNATFCTPSRSATVCAVASIPLASVA